MSSSSSPRAQPNRLILKTGDIYANLQVKTAMDLLMHSRGADEAEKYLRKTIKAYDEDLEAGYRARVALIEVLMHRVWSKTLIITLNTFITSYISVLSLQQSIHI